MNIFSHSVDSICILVLICFEVLKFFILFYFNVVLLVYLCLCLFDKKVFNIDRNTIIGEFNIPLSLGDTFIRKEFN